MTRRGRMGMGSRRGWWGSSLRGRRESVVLCTKFGILPAQQGGWKQKLKPVARAALRVFPGLRKTMQRQVGDQFVSGQFTVETLRTSFETSLRELKTEYVDMLLLHAAPATVLEQDDLLEAMGRLVESGKVRMAGISGELPVISRYFRAAAEGAEYGAVRGESFDDGVCGGDSAEWGFNAGGESSVWRAELVRLGVRRW